MTTRHIKDSYNNITQIFNTPDKKATFSFRMGKTSIAFISSFLRNPEKQNNMEFRIHASISSPVPWSSI